MKRRQHKEQVLKRKNFLPTFLVTVMLWILGFLLIYFVDPSIWGAIPFFFLLSFLIFLFTFSLIFADRRRGLITSFALTFFTFLLYLGVGNIINFLIIAAIAVCIELYLGAK
jgi:hypothetical protein